MKKKDNELSVREPTELQNLTDELLLDEFSILELDDRLEFISCCNINCNCGSC